MSDQDTQTPTIVFFFISEAVKTENNDIEISTNCYNYLLYKYNDNTLNYIETNLHVLIHQYTLNLNFTKAPQVPNK